jgi:hypothetical protein
MPHLPFGSGLIFYRYGAAQDLLQQPDDFLDGNTRSPSDIENFSSYVLLQREKVGLHGIRNESEISGLLSVAIDFDRFSLEATADETIKCHIRPLPRAIDSEVAKGNDRNPVVFPIEMAEVLAGQLRHSIRGKGLKIGILTHGELPIGAINRRGGGINQSLDSPSPLFHGFQEPLRGIDVVSDIRVKVLPPGFSHPSLCRMVKDIVAVLNQGSEVRLHHVRFYEAEGGMGLTLVQIRLFHRPGIIIGEAIQPHYMVAFGQEPLTQMGSNESRGPRYERFRSLLHLGSFLSIR